MITKKTSHKGIKENNTDLKGRMFLMAGTEYLIKTLIIK